MAELFWSIIHRTGSCTSFPLRVPPNRRVVRPEPVVVQVGFRIEVLPRVAQVDAEVALERRDLVEAPIRDGGPLIPEGTVAPLPAQIAVRVDGPAWRVQVSPLAL